MYINTIKLELKRIVRDKMTLVLAIYPLIIAFLGKYLLSNQNIASSEIAIQLIMILFSIMGAYLYGAVLGFSIIEDEEDRVLESIKISRISVKFYILLKTMIIFVLGFIGNYIIIAMVSDLSIIKNIAVSFVSALQVPIIGLFINLTAKNKVEGFVAMKGSGFIFFIPVIGALFFNDWKEFLFSISPAFWPAKAIQTQILPTQMNLSFSNYLLIGLLYNLILSLIIYYIYKKKHSI